MVDGFVNQLPTRDFLPGINMNNIDIGISSLGLKLWPVTSVAYCSIGIYTIVYPVPMYIIVYLHKRNGKL